jgi:hypothetical protein
MVVAYEIGKLQMDLPEDKEILFIHGGEDELDTLNGIVTRLIKGLER